MLISSLIEKVVFQPIIPVLVELVGKFQNVILHKQRRDLPFPVINGYTHIQSTRVTCPLIYFLNELNFS